MKPTRDHLDLLNDIRTAASKARQFISGLDYAAFVADEKSIYAVVRALEIVGEATKRIPQEIRDLAPTIPWRSMAGSRDKLIHDYITVDLENVWHTVVVDLPSLDAELASLIQTIEGLPPSEQN
jgi:uncharacterized protein with HEPN domain